jgi:hypothetical protein
LNLQEVQENNKWHLVGVYSSVITMMHGPTNIKKGEMYLKFYLVKSERKKPLRKRSHK